MTKQKHIDTPEAWIAGISALHDRFITDYFEAGDDIESDGEKWSITQFKYSEERHRLSIEFDNGDIYMIVEYSRAYETLIVSAWADRRMTNWGTEPDNDDEGLDEDSVRLLHLSYLPKVESRHQAERRFDIYDPACSFDFAQPEHVSLFAFMVGKLEESALFPLARPFDFRSAKRYVEQQKISLEAHMLMRQGMVDSWYAAEKDWDVLES